MAKYTFICDKCHVTQQMYVGSSLLEKECQCGGTLHRQLPKLSQSTSYEKPDKDSACRWIDDQPAVIQSRKEQFYWSVEVPRMVNSGTFSIETMLDNGWITVSEEGNMIINTKPPSQR